MKDSKEYRQCTLSVMDTISDPNIKFDDNGISNYFYEYKIDEQQNVLTGEKGRQKLVDSFEKIKQAKGTKRYDSILGLSGGVDSTFLCLLAKEHGLNPLVVHCDNGWNSELAQRNIEQTVRKCGFDLFTYVINWQEFRAMQLAYLRASVVDIEVLTDHAFMAVLYEQARKWKIKYVLAGMNIVTEQVLPSYWIYDKGDAENIKDIVNKYGDIPIKKIKTFPFLNYKTKRYCDKVLKIEVLSPLNWIEYNYDKVKKHIISEIGWQEYGGKHYESIWTRFYQGYILPNKFNIDKRKAHFSNLIFSGQLTKAEAITFLQKPIIDNQLVSQDLDFVMKKFGLSNKDFEEIMKMPRREHSEFAQTKGFRSQNKLFYLVGLAKDTFFPQKNV